MKTGEHIVLVGTGRLARALSLSFPADVVTVVPPPGRRASVVDGFPEGTLISDEFPYIELQQNDTIWLAVSDQAIAVVAETLAAEREDWGGIAVVHSSGATPPAVLDPFARRGALVMALHPNTSLTGRLPIPQGLVWSIAPDTLLTRGHAGQLLGGLDPQLAPLEDSMRPLYHAAAALASNYSLTLFATAVDLFVQAGIGKEEARRAVEHLMRASVDRASRHDPVSILTGPISRGDVGVVEAHLHAIARSAPGDLELYLALARATALLLDRSGGDVWEELFGRFRQQDHREGEARE